MAHSAAQTLNAFRAALPDEARLYVGGCSGEPLGFAEHIRETPEFARGVTFLGVWIPGVNRTDWSALSDASRAEGIFLSQDLRASFEARRFKYRPIPYTQAWPWLQTTPLDGAVLLVSPPDDQGRVSLGVSADFAGAVFGRGGVKTLALVNEAMPAPPHAPRLPLSEFDFVAEDSHPLVQSPPSDLPCAFEPLARNIATLLDDGATLQFGLGNVQQAVLGALKSHRSLKIHSGMISDPVLDLIDAGAVERITTGVAIGSDALYRRMAHEPNIRFEPVSFTHSISTLAAIDGFTAINSVIEVDLFGQANAEFLRGKQISGTGGLVDFLRGARAAPGGRGIAALLSSAKDGQISRIVPHLPTDATSIARADMDMVVTEHDVAELRGKDIDARAEAIIGIAAPEWRDTLAEKWAEMRRAM